MTTVIAVTETPMLSLPRIAAAASAPSAAATNGLGLPGPDGISSTPTAKTMT